MKQVPTSARPNSRLGICIIISAVLAVLVLAGTFFSGRMKSLLYQESVSQLEEISQQLFEKLDVQIDIQWGYLDKLASLLEQVGSLTQQELAEYIAHCEADLSPVGTQIYFRVIDEDGHYYTDVGRQGIWTGVDRLTGTDRQSFLIANWPDNETYMAFAIKLSEGMTVDGSSVEYLILLRSMSDMQPFFHSSAFAERNVAYIIDYDGFVLSSDGSLPGIDFAGKNLYYSLQEQSYPHMGSFAAVLKQGESSGSVCTDVEIGGNRYFLVYDRLPDYDWAVLLLMDAGDVAVSATEMVSSMLCVFLGVGVLCILAVIVIMWLVTSFRRDKILLEERKNNEEKLINANRALEKAHTEMERALAKVKTATEAKSQFLSNMSHDIRTPMNAILGMANLMEYEVEHPEKQRYYIKKLQKSGQYMLGLINDILDMSKIESGEVQITLEPVKLAEQAGQIESIIRSQSNEKGQTFTLRVHELTHEYLIGDSIRIRQIFLNLLTNAVKYTPNGGSILFEIAELPCDDPGCATIRTSVIDNGYGMKADFLESIFKPFTREQNSSINKIQGTGLGMSITKSLVDLMGGTITVQSEFGKGSRFDVTLTLPIDKDAIRVPNIGSVLLISSEEVLTANVKAALRETSVVLRVAITPDAAIALLREEPTDAILLSGWLNAGTLPETVQRLREASRDAVLIFCCDYAHREGVRDALVDSGIDGLITRPFFFENLVLAVDHSREEGMLTEREEHRSQLYGRRFLCAEDNALNAEILEALLSIHGATCTICPDGAALVEKFASVKPGDYDAILMDVQMPNMNGMEATRLIRTGENPLGRTIPVVAMTANAFSTDVEECLDAGMDAHLSKPLDINAMERTLHELFNESVAGGGHLSTIRRRAQSAIQTDFYKRPKA